MFVIEFAAVAKSSSTYKVMQGKMGFFKLKWPWKADAHGAVAGAIGEATGGATAGGAGAIVGGVLDAIGGGIGESVATFLFGD
ncbi:hypothetical protein [uncultured Chryseobacterium sp.]|uniref:hypothetical protein n=1 Tax=uncultured Chryseobacterium sp. TaxID=259322 RepID=UPI0025E03A03|nr:hypothetical protein [uncultured Chryseobacterium sp.]